MSGKFQQLVLFNLNFTEVKLAEASERHQGMSFYWWLMTIYDYGRSPEHWFLAIDIASCNITFWDPSELAIDLLCWMDANDFDVAFVGDKEGSIVRKERLIGCDKKATVAQYTEDVPHERSYSINLSLNDAFRELMRQDWFILQDDGGLIGMVTSQDTSKPAASAFVMAHLITVERILRRMLGTYSNRPMPDEPKPTGVHSHRDTTMTEIAYFSDVINNVKNEELLLEDLGYKKNEYKKLGRWAVTFRDHLAHSRGLNYDEPTQPSALERFFEVQKLMFRALTIVEDRKQIWNVIQESIVTSSTGEEHYAGPDAIDLPVALPGYVITAANPFEEILEDNVNEHRNKMLHQVLQRKVEIIVDVIGRSRCGSWEEASFLVGGIPKSEILSLAEKFGQRAVFKLTANEKIVIATNGEEKSRTSRHN